MSEKKMKVAVVGGGISGLVAAHVLSKEGLKVVLYEKEDYLGGHAKTVTVDGGVDLDLGFMVFNRVTYPNMMEFFENLGVDMEVSDMSFSVSLDKGIGCEWGSRNGLSSLFAQKKNILNPYFWQMIREIIKFKQDVLRYLEEVDSNPDINRNETLEHFVKSHGYSELFQKAYLVPICASIWSCSSEGVIGFSAYSVLSFCRNHHLLQLFGRPEWLTVTSRSHTYVKKVKDNLEKNGCEIRSGCEVSTVSANEEGCVVTSKNGSIDIYDACIVATHAPDALKLLGDTATHDEHTILGAFKYAYSDIYLHRDENLMPKNRAAWSAWNFLGTIDNKVCVTYWLNILQNITETEKNYFVTLNPPYTPEYTSLKWTTGHPVPSVAASIASSRLDHIQGKRGIWFCGAYQGKVLEFIFKHSSGLVKRTGCQYTGITLSEEQLKFAQQKVKEAGLQDNISLLLCDYRQLPEYQKYDRIISCEMLEAVGHEFMEKFFSCCESVLAENGILVLQFISIPDERYEEYRQSSDFIKEYIFPGGCLPSLSRVTSAMATASRLWEP